MTAKRKSAKNAGKRGRPKVVKETVRDLDPKREGDAVKGGVRTCSAAAARGCSD